MNRALKLGIGLCCVMGGTVLLSAAPAPVFERRPFLEEYVDADTGVRLPPRIGNYRKNEVVKNFNPLIGTVIRYADPQGNCADIYIYSLDSTNQVVSEKAALTHFREIKQAIENLPKRLGHDGYGNACWRRSPKRLGHVKEVQALGEEALRCPPKVAGRCATFRLNIIGELRISELAVFPFRQKIIKIRASTSPCSSKEEFHYADFLKTVCEAFNAVK